MATLVKELERQGIGRPSTYASILENITARGYIVEGKKDFLEPTETGIAIRDALVSKFKFAELAYTSELEQSLDEIAESKQVYLTIVKNTWEQLDKETLDVRVNLEIKEKCPACAKPMLRRKGQHGFFWGCSAYPVCKTVLPDEKGKMGEKKEEKAQEKTSFSCIECGSALIRRKGVSAKTKKSYDFFACSGFPKCNKSYQTGADNNPILAN